MALEQDVRRIVGEMLKDPLSLPSEFRSWIPQWVEISGVQIPTSQITGLLWASYTPVLTATVTNPTLGSGSTQSGRYAQIGKLVIANVYVAFGTSGTGAGSGSYRVSLPVNAGTTIASKTMGPGLLSDNGGGNYLIEVGSVSTSTVGMVAEAADVVTEASPFAWAAQDSLRLLLVYEAA